MKIIGAKHFQIDPLYKKWFSVIFECEHEGNNFSIMSSCPLSDFELTKMDCGIVIDRSANKIPIADAIKLYGCLKGNCLVKITSSNPVKVILQKLKIEIEEKRHPFIPKDSSPPATPDQVRLIFEKFRHKTDMDDAKIEADKNQREHGDGWYERAKSHGD